MKRKLIIMIPLLALIMVMVGCEQDDDEEIPVKLSFNMINSNGKQTNIFNIGEPIIFDLSIENVSSNTVPFIYNIHKNNGIEIGSDLFRVYDEKGNDYGVPWSGQFCLFTEPEGINAKSKFHLYCSWSGIDINNPFRCTYPLCKVEDNKPLPSGNYHCSFEISYKGDNNKITKILFTTNFKIR